MQNQIQEKCQCGKDLPVYNAEKHTYWEGGKRITEYICSSCAAAIHDWYYSTSGSSVGK